jgi:hypothetical protein
MGYNIPVGETIHPAFMITYGDNSLTIRRKVKAVRTYYYNILSDVEESQENEIPIEYSLDQNYPNPFNPITTISYSLPVDGLVKIKVYDLLGREMITVVNNFQVAGRHLVQVDGSNLSSGIYFYSIEAGSFRSVKKMILLK